MAGWAADVVRALGGPGVGALVALVLAGDLLGASRQSAGRDSDWIDYALIAALALALAVFVARRARNRPGR